MFFVLKIAILMLIFQIQDSLLGPITSSAILIAFQCFLWRWNQHCVQGPSKETVRSFLFFVCFVEIRQNSLTWRSKLKSQQCPFSVVFAFSLYEWFISRSSYSTKKTQRDLWFWKNLRDWIIFLEFNLSFYLWAQKYITCVKQKNVCFCKTFGCTL